MTIRFPHQGGTPEPRGRKDKPIRKPKAATPKRLDVERLEDRLVPTGPQLVAILPNTGGLLLDNAVVDTPPRELTFRFNEGQSIDPNSLAGIRITRSGLDNIFGNGNDITVSPGFRGIGDQPNDVIFRFLEALPDDRYQIQIIGDDSLPFRVALQNTALENFNSGVDLTRTFDLDLGPQVLTVVPQPILRDIRIQVTTSSVLQDGDTFTLSDGVHAPVTFEFNDFASNPLFNPANVPIDFDSRLSPTNASIANTIRNQIDAAVLGPFDLDIESPTQAGSTVRVRGLTDTPEVALQLTNSAAVQLFDGGLVQRSDLVVVYFNTDATNELAAAVAADPAFYHLIDTRGTLDVGDDVLRLPQSVVYQPGDPSNGVTARAILDFDAAGTTPLPAGTFRLRVGISNDAPNTFATAYPVGTVGAAQEQQTIGPEVANGTIIDNDLLVGQVGQFAVDVLRGGSAGAASGMTADGIASLLVNQNLIVDLLNYVDVGPAGGGFRLGGPGTNISQEPTLIAPDTVRSSGTFLGDVGQTINWTVTSQFAPGSDRLVNTITFTGSQPLGNLRFVNYLDHNVGPVTNDELLLTSGTVGMPDFRAVLLDDYQRVGFRQGGEYSVGAGLVNAAFDGWSADKAPDLRNAIETAGAAYTPAGTVDAVDLPAFTGPRLTGARGRNNVSSAFAWTVNPTAITSTITTFTELVSQDPTLPALANGSFQTAGVIGDNSATLDANDVDLYRVEVLASGPLTVTATPDVATLNTRLRLFDQFGNFVSADNGLAGAGAADTLTLNVPLAGTFYVGVSSDANVAYNPLTGTNQTGGTSTGAYRLDVAFGAIANISDDNTQFSDATSLGVVGVSEITVRSSIDPQLAVLPFPGAENEPGHRDIPYVTEDHLPDFFVGGLVDFGNPDSEPGIQTVEYNFQQVYGVDPNTQQPLTNQITANQRDRAREILQLYSEHLGIQFVETANRGLTIATGDLRAINPNQPSIANDGIRSLTDGLRIVIDAAENWGQSESGGAWFRQTMAEIALCIGIGNTDDLPQPNARTGFATANEQIVPSPADILHGQFLHRPESNDIDLYRFQVPAAGELTAEIVAERLAQSSQLDAVLTLYAEFQTLAVPANGGAGLIDTQQFVINDGAGSVTFEFDRNNNMANPNARRIQFNPTDSATRIADEMARVINETVADGDLHNLTAVADAGRVKLQGNITIPVTGPLALSTAREVVSRNDDYFSSDSLIRLHANAGSYFLAVTSTGNTNFDPSIRDSGFGGTTQGQYDLRIKLDADPVRTLTDTDNAPTALDGDGDGLAGGEFNFWFQSGTTIYVDKAAPAGGTGTLAAPYTTIAAAITDAAGRPTPTATNPLLVRIVGNGGPDANPGTLADNLEYQVGRNNGGTPLPDGTSVQVPRGVTVMVDPGAVFKNQQSIFDVGTSQPAAPRPEGALQLLGVFDRYAYDLAQRTNDTDAIRRLEAQRVTMTSFRDDSIGGNDDGAGTAAQAGNWGGLIFRADSDREAQGIFLSHVSGVHLQYGGGLVNSVVVNPIHLAQARPTIAHNVIRNTADAAISADPNSFEETLFDLYDRVGPDIHNNRLTGNNINGLFVRISTQFGQPVDRQDNLGRWDDTDIVHVLAENLIISGTPGGPVVDATTALRTGQLDARLSIDPGVVVKISNARIEAEVGAQFLAEGMLGNEIILTSLLDDEYGVGGAFDTTNNGAATGPAPANWSGIYFGPTSSGGIDRALIAYAGGSSGIEGGADRFNAIEIHQADVRIANSTLRNNDDGLATASINGLPAGVRNGRGTNTPAVIYVSGAQPILVNNVIRNNVDDGANDIAVISIDVNSLQAVEQPDLGRTTGIADVQTTLADNYGPLIHGNRIGGNDTNGVVIRNGALNTASIWDDTDIVHVVFGEISILNQHEAGGLRLQSKPDESLVIKLSGANAGFTANGLPLDIDDRIGGTLQVIGAPQYPVVMTSVNDCTAGAGLAPDGQLNSETILGVCGAFTAPALDIFFLLDDTGSFESVGPALTAQFDTIISTLQAALPNTSLAAGIGRFEEYGSFVFEDAEGRPFTLNQPILDVTDPQFAAASASALNRTTPGFGGDGPETAIEALFQIATGSGFDGNDDGDTTDSGASGLVTTQVTPGASGDVPAFSTFVADPTGPVVAGSGAAGGVGWRTNSQRLVLLATDVGFAYEPDGVDPYVGVSGVTAPASVLQLVGRGTTPGGRGAEIQATLNALIASNIQVIGLGTSFTAGVSPEPQLSALAQLTGAVDANGNPLYFPIDPNTSSTVSNAIVTAILSAGANAGPGDWRSIRLNEFANDRNVAYVPEAEETFTGGDDQNNDPFVNAQPLGNLAPNEVSGDENLRLGFTVSGSISFDAPGDVDVYSFAGAAGTEVWIDIDRTSHALDTVVELLDGAGNLIARSNDSRAEQLNPALIVGAGLSLNKDPFIHDRFGGASGAGDLYSTNPRDAGVRVILPGILGTSPTYYLRVRSNSADLNNLSGGESKGRYDLQLRLRQTDEAAGSLVKYSDIRFATNGIEVSGLPSRSPLTGEAAETLAGDGSDLGSTSQTSNQNLGNLLATDRNVVSVAGRLHADADIDYYRFTIDYQLVGQGSPFTNGTFSTVFDLDYADGLTRPDTVMAIFNAETGQLIYVGRDSNIDDDRPLPGAANPDFDLSRGTTGPLDPYMGTLQLPEGNYIVAVASNGQLPTQLNQTFLTVAANNLVRLEPVNSVTRIVEDHIGFSGYTSNGAVVAPRGELFDSTSFMTLSAHTVPSTVGTNLWHPTLRRRADLGHGVNTAPDNSRIDNPTHALPGGQNVTEREGGYSYYFGLEATGTYDVTGIDPNGIAAGAIESNSFSLAGYSGLDKPTLYFNYYLETDADQNNAGRGLGNVFDTARVYVSRDGGTIWELLATNNSTPNGAVPGERPANLTSSGVGQQRVQELYDADQWRQARIDLSEFAGEGDVRLRFDFSTAGAAGDANLLVDDVNNNGFVDPQDVPTDSFGNPLSPQASLFNNFEGWYIDDIMVGFAERGEMVTSAAPDATGFFAVAGQNDATPGSAQLLQGPYQLEIRRGYEHASSLAPTGVDIRINETLDTNDRLADGFVIIAPDARVVIDGEAFTVSDGVNPAVTFEFNTGVIDRPGVVDIFVDQNPLTATPSSPAQIAAAIATAINAAANLDVTATVSPNGNRVQIIDAVAVSPLATARIEDVRVDVVAAQVPETNNLLVTTVIVSRTGDTTNPLVVNLSTPFNGDEVILQNAVTILAGSSSVSIPLLSVNDMLADGTQTVHIVPAAAGFNSISDTVDVTDIDTPTLTLQIMPGSITETGGTISATATVTRNTPTVGDLTVNLASLDMSEATLSNPTVTIPAGQASETFTVTAFDDAEFDGTQTVNIVAYSPGFDSAIAALDVQDANDLAIEFDAPTVNEGGSINGRVRRGAGNTANAITVTLTSSDPTTGATVTNMVTIPAASTVSNDFVISGVIDGVADGRQTVTITADATLSGFTLATADIIVLDADPQRLTIDIDPFAVNEAFTDHFSGMRATVARVIRDGDLTLPVSVGLSTVGNNLVVVDQNPSTPAPDGVTIPAGRSYADFLIFTVNDVLSDGTVSTQITPSALGYAGVSATVSVADNERLFSIAVADDDASMLKDRTSAQQPQLPIQTTVVVRRPFTVESNSIPAQITSSPGSALDINLNVSGQQSTFNVAFPSGTDSVTFDVRAQDDATNTGPRTETLTVTGGDLAQIVVGDLEGSFLTMSIVPNDPIDAGSTSKSLLAEGQIATVVLTRQDNPSFPVQTTALPISIGGIDGTRLQTVGTLPTQFPAGDATVSFMVQAVDDTLVNTDDDFDGDRDRVAFIRVDGPFPQFSPTIGRFRISDNDAAQLVFRIEDPNNPNMLLTSVPEDGGLRAAVGRISRPNAEDISRPLAVTLSFGIPAADATELNIYGGLGRSALGNTVVPVETGTNGAPITVTIPAGRRDVTFDIDSLNDSIPDGTQTVVINAAATDFVPIGQPILFQATSATLDVTDVPPDVGALILTINSASIAENNGLTTATVTRTGDTFGPLDVMLQVIGATSKVNVPVLVNIPAGMATSLPFNITANDDAIADGTQTVVITPVQLGGGAVVPGDAIVSDSLDITDNEVATMTLVINPNAISENDGLNASMGTVTRNTPTTLPLTVTIINTDRSKVSIPGQDANGMVQITIPANQTSTTFQVDALDKFLINDGDRDVKLAAAADAHLSGNDTITVSSSDNILDFLRLGDRNHEFRDQGQLIIESNRILDSEQSAIVIDAVDSATISHPGAPRNLPVLNNERLAPGVVVTNNLIAGFGQTGITFSGSASSRQVVPFGRIVNNTIFGNTTPTGIGIQVTNNASPTILNNIVSGVTTGIDIDGSSSTTIYQANAYKDNGENVRLAGAAAPLGSFDLALGQNDPLFVDEGVRNFYLLEDSLAVDSSRNSVDDRSNYVDVKQAVGIPESPIFAPALDLIGNERSDDPNTPNAGGGLDIFRDRGALDRTDFVGPTARLILPLDNDPNNDDSDRDLSEVLINEEYNIFAPLTDLIIELVDEGGIGIDDIQAGDATRYVLTRDGIPLVEGLDYFFDYEAFTDRARFTASGVFDSGVFSEGTYVIQLARSPFGSAIQDLAQNPVQPNQLDGSTRFTIVNDTLPPSVTLTAPLDNGTTDSETTIDIVAVQASPAQIDLTLDGTISDINDITVSETGVAPSFDFTITYSDPNIPVMRPLVLNTDFRFDYDFVTNVITLRPLAALGATFPRGEYRFQLGDGVAGSLDDIEDIAGNRYRNARGNEVRLVVRDLVLSTTAVAVTEGTPAPNTATFTVALSFPPAAGQQVRVDLVTTGVDPQTDGEVTAVNAANGNSFLIFTSANWNVAQTVRVTAVDDPRDERDPVTLDPIHAGLITLVATSTDLVWNNVSRTVDAAVTDNDISGITTAGTVAVTEGNALGGTFSVVLDTMPTGTVSIALSSDAQVTARDNADGDSTLVFTAANWNVPQLVRVIAVNDLIDETDPPPANSLVTLDISSAVDLHYNALPDETVPVSVTDNDIALINFNPLGGIQVEEEGSTNDLFEVTLNSEPTSAVTITLNPDAQVVATDDSDSDATLIFTPANWNVPQVVRVAAVDDQIDEGADTVPHAGTVNLDAASADPFYDPLTRAVPVGVLDNDTAALDIDLVDGQIRVTEGGATDTIRVRLATQPVGNVVIDLTPVLQVTAVDGSQPANNFLTFTSLNWNVFQTVLIAAVNDSLDETPDPHAGSVTLNPSSGTDGIYDALATRQFNIQVTDNDVAGVAIDLVDGVVEATETDTPTPAQTDTFTVVLTSEPTAEVTVRLATNGQVLAEDDNTPGVTQLVFTAANWNVPQTIRVSASGAANDDIDEGPNNVPHAGLVTVSTSSTDGLYASLPAQTVDVDVFDDDNAALIVDLIDAQIQVTEGGATDTFRVSLASQPTAAVTVRLTTNGQVTAADNANPNNAFLTFTPANWNMPQTVLVTANGPADDRVDEGPNNVTHAGAITLAIESSDPVYASAPSQTLNAGVFDNDIAGITTGQLPVQVTEGGPASSFTVVLDTQPTANVTIRLANDGQTLAVDDANIANDFLTFTPLNWNVAQSVRVTAVNDSIDEGDNSVALVSNVVVTVESTDPIYDDNVLVPGETVPVNVFDNDTSGFTLTQSAGSTAVVEGQGPDTVTVVLTSEPTANVRLTLTGDGQVTGADAANTANAFVDFTPANWNVPQTINVRAVEDAIDEVSPHNGVLTVSVSAGDARYLLVANQTVTAAVTDNDTAAVRINASGTLRVNENGGTYNYTVVLGSQPTSNVTVTLTTNGQVTARDLFGNTTLTFTPADWNNPRQITVQAVNDAIDELDTHTGQVIHAVSVPVGGDPFYAALASQTLSFEVLDNDTAAVNITPTAFNLLEGGATGSYQVVLTSEPTANVLVTLLPDSQVTAQGTGGATLTFTPANWNTPQTVTVSAIDDSVAESQPHTGRVQHQITSADTTYNAMATANVVVTITDNDSAGVVVDTIDANLAVDEAGGVDTFRVSLRSQPTANVTLSLSAPAGQVTAVDDTNPTSSILTFTPSNWNIPQTVRVQAVNDAIDEDSPHAGDIELSLASGDPVYSGLRSTVTANVTDNDTAGAAIDLLDGSIRVTEGGSVDTYTVVLTSQPTSGVLVTLISDSQATADQNGLPINAFLIFTPQNWNVPQTGRATAVDDAIDEANPHAGNITVHVSSVSDARYNAVADQQIAATIFDNDAAAIIVNKSSVTLSEAGQTDTVTVVLGSQPTANVTVNLTGNAQVGTNPAQLLFTPQNWNVAQTATVSATDDSIDEGADSTPHQAAVTVSATSGDTIYAGLAAQTITANITDNETAGITLTQSGGSTAVSEDGQTDDYQIVLNTQPQANVTITITPDAQTTATPTQLTFTPSNWNQPQTINAAAVDDLLVEGPHTGRHGFDVASTDAIYDVLSINDVVIAIADNDSLGDNFNRADNPSLGTNWTERTGDFAIVGNTASPVTNATAVATLNGAIEEDVAIDADIDVTGGPGHAGIFGRYSGPGDSNMFLAALVNTGSGFEANLWVNVGGQWTPLASTPVNNGAGHVRFEIVGDSLKMFLDGAIVLQTVNGQLSGPGQVGMRATQGTTIDNFAIEELAPTNASLPFTDPFTQATGTPLAAVWSVAQGNYLVSGNVATGTDQSLNLAVLNGVAQTDVIVEADVTSTAGHVGLVARYTGPGDNSMYLGAFVRATSSVDIWKNAGGQWTQLATAPVTGTAGNLRFEVAGASLRLVWNGTLATSTTDTSLVAPGTVGIRGQGGTTVDNFHAEITQGGNNNVGGLNVTSGGFILGAQNEFVATSTGNNVAVDPTSLLTNSSVQANVTLQAGSNLTHAGVVLRHSGQGDGATYLGALVRNNGVRTVELWRNSGGNWVQLRSVVVANDAGLLRLDATGSGLSLFFDDQLMATAIDAVLPGPGLAGIRGTIGTTFRNFDVN